MSTQVTVHEAPNGYVLALVGAAEAFTAFVAALWNDAKTVTQRQKELVFLRTSIVNHCDT
jgi:hypothetical protein